MLHPFGDEPAEAAPTARAGANNLLDNATLHEDGRADQITSRSVKDHRAFLQSPDIVLRPHHSSSTAIRDRFVTGKHSPAVTEAIEPYVGKIQEAVGNIHKHYRIYVETASGDLLEREAYRLERRYFRDGATEQQIKFLKLRRYYEKIRTFHELAKEEWREISKILDTLVVMNDSRTLARSIESEHMRHIALLTRQTDSFLDDLKLYLGVEQENKDAMTGSHKVQVSFRPDVEYTLNELLGVQEANATQQQVEQQEEKAPKRPRDFSGSIASNIVLESREHKLNRASFISVPIVGSRDWNRTPEYRFEVPLVYFEQCVATFRRAYQVNTDESQLRGPLNIAAAQVLEGRGDEMIPEYHHMVLEIVSETADVILDEDFPGLALPDVFLYHCGANVFYQITLKVMRRKGLGEIFYVDETKNTVREYPDELIKKIIVDWWTDRFKDIPGEEVDSYLTYSRQMEMVKREYRILYEEGVQLRKKENPNVTYLGVEKWLYDNRNRVFGERKVEIFRRFIPGTVLE